MTNMVRLMAMLTIGKKLARSREQLLILTGSSQRSCIVVLKKAIRHDIMTTTMMKFWKIDEEVLLSRCFAVESVGVRQGRCNAMDPPDVKTLQLPTPLSRKSAGADVEVGEFGNEP